MTRRPLGRPGCPGILLVLLLFSPPPDVSPTGKRNPAAHADEDRARVAREIQNACFAQYPPDLIREMSGHDGPVPEEIRSDPARRQEFLRTEGIARKGLFYPSLLVDLLPALTAVVRPGTRFLDLGSGDGRVVFMAAHLGAHATGIEYERRLHRIARAARRQLTEHLETGRTRFVRGDFFDHDFSGYDVLFYFGRGSFGEDRLLGKIRTELRSDAILLFSYPPGDLPGMTRIAIHGQVSVYRIDSEGE